MNACRHNDLQSLTLERQIQDWRTCPTTDPKTKREKVAELQAKLDALDQTSGLGQNLDVAA